MTFDENKNQLYCKKKSCYVNDNFVCDNYVNYLKVGNCWECMHIENDSQRQTFYCKKRGNYVDEDSTCKDFINILADPQLSQAFKVLAKEKLGKQSASKNKKHWWQRKNK
jgi:hypothetical protein